MRAVNLIPDDQRGGVSLGAGRSEGTAYAVLVLIGGLAVLAFLYGSARHQISNRTSQAASITAEVSQVQARRLRSRPTRASSRCANSAPRRSPNSSTRALTGRTACTSSAACCPRASG